MEVRGKKLKAGVYFLGCKGKIWATIELGTAQKINSIQEWKALKDKHCVETKELPYKNTFGFPLEICQRFETPIYYIHPKGAIGIVKYR